MPRITVIVPLDIYMPDDENELHGQTTEEFVESVVFRIDELVQDSEIASNVVIGQYEIQGDA